VIMIADVMGAMKIRAMCPDANLIFILPRTWEELEKRVRERHDGKEDVIEEHLLAAQEQILCTEQYDYILISEIQSDLADELRSL